MTTTPCKLWSRRLYEVLQEIKEQTYRPDAIYLAIAKAGKRDNQPYVIPPWLKKDTDITILRTEVDLGPVMKMHPALVRESDPETRLITMDDDGSYRRDMIAHLVDWSLHYPDAALSFGNGLNITCLLPDTFNCDINYHGRKHYYVMTQQDSEVACHNEWRELYGKDMCAAYSKTEALPVHIIQGVGGCLYVRKTFGRDFFLLSEKWEDNPCWFNDDFWTSAQLAKRGVKRYVVPENGAPPIPVLFGHSIDRDVPPFQFEAFSVPFDDSGNPIESGKCATELHGMPDRMFDNYNRKCAFAFKDYFEAEILPTELAFFEKPNFLLPA